MSATEVNSGRIASWKRYALFTLALLFIGSVPQARTYRWTDESGGIVYSQTPPPSGVEADIIDTPNPPSESLT